MRRAVADDPAVVERDDGPLRVGHDADERSLDVRDEEAGDRVDRQRGLHDRAQGGFVARSRRSGCPIAPTDGWVTDRASAGAPPRTARRSTSRRRSRPRPRRRGPLERHPLEDQALVLVRVRGGPVGRAQVRGEVEVHSSSVKPGACRTSQAPATTRPGAGLLLELAPRGDARGPRPCRRSPDRGRPPGSRAGPRRRRAGTGARRGPARRVEGDDRDRARGGRRSRGSRASRRPARSCRRGTSGSALVEDARVDDAFDEIGPGGILRGRVGRGRLLAAASDVGREVDRSRCRTGGACRAAGRSVTMSPGRTRCSDPTIATMSGPAAVTWRSSSLPRYSTTSARARIVATPALGLADVEVLRTEADDHGPSLVAPDRVVEPGRDRDRPVGRAR